MCIDNLYKYCILRITNWVKIYLKVLLLYVYFIVFLKKIILLIFIIYMFKNLKKKILEEVYKLKLIYLVVRL